MNFESTRRAVRLSLLLGLLPAACGVPEESSPCDGRAMGKSEACCPMYGKDACGAGLFCAAFDGRVVHTCYELHSRAGGQTCTEGEQCVSGQCSLSTSNNSPRVCLSVVGERCFQNADCLQANSATFFACTGNVCAAQTGECESACQNSSHCRNGVPCTMGVCGHAKGARYYYYAYAGCCVPGSSASGICSGGGCDYTCR